VEENNLSKNKNLLVMVVVLLVVSGWVLNNGVDISLSVRSGQYNLHFDGSIKSKCELLMMMKDLIGKQWVVCRTRLVKKQKMYMSWEKNEEIKMWWTKRWELIQMSVLLLWYRCRWDEEEKRLIFSQEWGVEI